MIPLSLIAGAIVIVLICFRIHELAYCSGYEIGHRDGFAHAMGRGLPAPDAWELTAEGADALDAKQAEWDREVNDRINPKSQIPNLKQERREA